MSISTPTTAEIIGARLPNGGLVVVAHPTAGDALTRAGWYILADLGEATRPHRYVTWWVAADDRSAYWGHYHAELAAAREDLAARAAR